MQTALKSTRGIGDTTRVVASPDDFHDEIHESELSEDSEQFSDEGSDYGNCALATRFCSCVYTDKY